MLHGILMISEEYSPSHSTLTRVSVLAKHFAREGHRVVLLSNSGRLTKENALSTLLGNLISRRFDSEGVAWFFPPVLRTGSTRGPLKALEGLLAIGSTLVFGAILLTTCKSSIDVIYSSTAQVQGFIGSLLSTALRKRLVANFGDPAFARDTGLVRRFERVLEKITLSKSDHVFAVDPVIVEYVRSVNRLNGVGA